MNRATRTGQDELKKFAREAMLQRGLLPEFSPAVRREARAIRQAPMESTAAIRDLRGLPWASIDNDDSRDLDQLSVAEPLAQGAVKVLVAVAAWLDGAASAPPKLAAVPGLDEQLRMQDRAAQALKRLRHERGALRLKTAEARPVFDHGVLTDLRPDEKNRAKELIEDFMIAANGVTARTLDRKGFPSLRRMLHTPKRWERIVELAAALGEPLPAQPSAIALDAFLAKRREKDPARFAELSLSIVKLLGSGEYMAVSAGRPSDGHFGLAVNDYTHSTAPNRRFPDLVTQRLLKAALAGDRVPYADEELAALARHCTVQEDNAAKVERQVRKSAAALLLAPRIGERFDAIVTGASPKGTWVRIERPTVEGRVVQGFEGLDVGDGVRVELVAVNAVRGFIDFRRARDSAPSRM